MRKSIIFPLGYQKEGICKLHKHGIELIEE